MNQKVLFICLHRPDRSPSQRFRFEQYLDTLGESGFDCRHVFILNAKDDLTFYSPGNYLKKVFILIKSINVLIRHTFFRKYDIAFVQREAIMLGTSYFERKMAKRAKLIFDFDDAIWNVQLGEFKSINRLFYFLKNPDKTNDIISAAHLVIAGNEYLADYAKRFNPNVKIIPTTIDTTSYTLTTKKDVEPICIGWSGSFSTIVYFEFALDALRLLKEKYKDRIYYKVIGDGNYKNEELNIRGIPWQKESEVKDLSEIDIGIMPLNDDEWTKGKCALKGLQYMALGIPSVISPVGVNADIITEGKDGFFATTTEEWVEKISLLIESYELRKQIGFAGRKIVEAKYSVDANKHFYIDYFNSL